MENLLLRFLGREGRYLEVYLCPNREAALAAHADPEIQEGMQAHLSSNYTNSPPVMEAYEVVQRAYPDVDRDLVGAAGRSR